MIGLFPDWKKPPLAIVADKACGRAKIRQHIADEAALTVILSNSDVRNPVLPDKTLHAMCDIVERFFCRVQGHEAVRNSLRKISDQLPRYDILARNQMLDQLSSQPGMAGP